MLFRSGFAMLGLTAVLSIRSLVMSKMLVIRVVLAVAFTLTVTTGAVAASSNNRLVVKQYNPGYLWPRQFFERAVDRGAFDHLRAGDSVFTPSGQWWFEAPFVSWWGGPRLKSIVDSIEDPQYAQCLVDPKTCAAGFNATFMQYGLFPTEVRAVMVARGLNLTSDGTHFTSLTTVSPRVYVELLQTFKDRKSTRLNSSHSSVSRMPSSA